MRRAPKVRLEGEREPGAAVDRRPLRWPWELVERPCRLLCPRCAYPAGVYAPSRRRKASCSGCGSVFNTWTGKVDPQGGGLPPGRAGVREPRRPSPGAPPSSLQMPEPE